MDTKKEGENTPRHGEGGERWPFRGTGEVRRVSVLVWKLVEVGRKRGSRLQERAKECWKTVKLVESNGMRPGECRKGRIPDLSFEGTSAAAATTSTRY